MNKAEESESSNDEETYQDYFTNPQKRKQFDSQRLYQQQKELQKMSGFNRQIIIEPPKRITEADNQKNYATVSLFCLTVTNPFRDKIIRVVLNQWFDRFILLIIVINCVFLAIDDPNLEQLDYQIIADYIFLVLFTIEMCLKIIAMGFALRPYSYLRDAWNILDFIVVIMGWISKVVTANNVSAIRVIRILRPLRTINSMPGMRKLVQSLLNSLPTLFDILVLFSFFLVMFGTIATQLFGGLLQLRCVDDASGETMTGDDNNGYFCQVDGLCPVGASCKNVGNPDFEVTSFDNILKSVLNIFIIITLEGWTDVMYKIRSATGSVAYDIFFILVVIIGAFFILNLMVAVQFSYLNAQFQEQKSKIEAQKLKETNQLMKIKEESPKSPIKEQVKFIDGFSQAVSEIDKKDRDISNNENNSDTSHPFKSPDQNQQNGQNEINLGNPEKDQKQPCYVRFQAKMFELVESRGFNITIIMLIMINTIFMAMEHYDQPEALTNAVNLGNSILTCIFAGEMVLKMFGLGLKAYVRDGFNVFDAIIVIVGLLEFLNAGSKALTVLRAFRLLRIFKIVKSWTTLKKLLQTVLNSFSSIANLGLLMFLLIFIYSLIGMQFFSGPIPDNEDKEFRFNFNTFGYSLITIFVMLTAENWNSILIQFIDKDGFAASIYFVSMIIFGNIMVLNLFLAILLSFISENLDQEDEKQSTDDENGGANDFQNEVVEEQFDYIQERLRVKAGIKSDKRQSDQNDQQAIEEQSKNPSDQQNNNQLDQAISPHEIQLGFNKNQDKVRISERSNEEESKQAYILNNEEGSHQDKPPNQQFSDDISINHNRSDQSKSLKLNNGSNNLNKSISNPESVSNLQKGQSGRKSYKPKNTKTVLNIQGRSLFIFGQDSKIRQTLRTILTHSYFENFIYHLIGLNSLILALDEPQLTDSYQTQTLELCVTIISGIFIAEAVAKIIVLGFAKGQNSYLKDYWNILDFTIVSFSVLNWVLDSFSDISVSFLRGFRALRALRPLRMVSKNEGMKIVVNSLLTSIPNLFNVMLISLLFYLVFGILGVQLFKGALGGCNDSTIDYKYNCVGKFIDPSTGEKTDRSWSVPFNNFDNIFYSMVTFFEIATLENWPSVMFAAIDSQDIDQGPNLDNRPYVAILFVVFIFITTFFVMNLFISVIVDKFNEEIKKKEGSHKFSEEQKEWVKMQRIMVHVNLKIKPVCPENKFRKFFFYMVMSKQFEFFISFVIALNTLFLCMDYYDAPLNYSNALQLGNIIFVSIFALEALLKMIAHGIKFYFLETWNKFDFVIVILSLIALDESIFSFKVNALRIIRVARLLRMIKASKGLRHLLKTLWLSIGNIANVGMLLFLIFFTFTVAGMDLFGDLNNSEYITTNANFKSFYVTIILLFRAATGENWNGIMHDCYDQSGVIGIFYWLAFELITHYIFLNVFIAVIYENFNDVKASEDENEVLSLKRKDIKAFVKTWAQFCPNGEHYMKTTDFAKFLQKLPPPLGYEGHNIERAKLNKIIFCLNIKSHLRENEGKVYFPEVMWAIFHSIIGNNDEQVHNCEQVTNIMKELKRKYKGLGKHVTPDSLCGNKYYRTEMTVSKYMCALQIYKNWKNFKSQREKLKQTRLQNQKSQLSNKSQEFNDKNRSSSIKSPNGNPFDNNQSNFYNVNQNSDNLKISDFSDAQLLNRDQIYQNNDQQRLATFNNNQSGENHKVFQMGSFQKIQSFANQEENKAKSRDENLSNNQSQSHRDKDQDDQLQPNSFKKQGTKGSSEMNNRIRQNDKNIQNIINAAIDEERESSFQTEELSEEVSDRYFNQDNSIAADPSNNRSDKKVLVDFAMIKGQIGIKDFQDDNKRQQDLVLNNRNKSLNDSYMSDRTIKQEDANQQDVVRHNGKVKVNDIKKLR